MLGRNVTEEYKIFRQQKDFVMLWVFKELHDGMNNFEDDNERDFTIAMIVNYLFGEKQSEESDDKERDDFVKANKHTVPFLTDTAISVYPGLKDIAIMGVMMKVNRNFENTEEGRATRAILDKYDDGYEPVSKADYARFVATLAQQ
jgi:hypothetical protein